ncbi:hypothetical protein TNCV_4684951 [Trichonephila clavipes]|nr:hypothetical protein TNCV_4684951 [Trichonephila clavipes]
MADKDIWELIQSSKNVIDVNSDDENEMNNNFCFHVIRNEEYKEKNEKVSNHGSIPITIDCNVVAFIVFEEGFHQPIKRTKHEKFIERYLIILLLDSHWLLISKWSRYPSGQDDGLVWPACHEFEPGTAEDPLCREEADAR